MDDERLFADLFANALSNNGGQRMVGIRHNHHKFFPAIAADQIDPAGIFADPVGEFLENFITRIVTMGIIDRFEMVNIQ